MMPSCEKCGSIRIVRARSGSVDRLITSVSGRRPFVCRRCGWRTRQHWTEDFLQQAAGPDHPGVDDTPSDFLDAIDSSEHGPFVSERSAESLDEFDPQALDQDLDGRTRRVDIEPATAAIETVTTRGKKTTRPFPSQRRNIIGSIALVASGMFLAQARSIEGAGTSGPPCPENDNSDKDKLQ